MPSTALLTHATVECFDWSEVGGGASVSAVTASTTAWSTPRAESSFGTCLGALYAIMHASMESSAAASMLSK